MADMNGDIRKEEISSCITNLGLQESILVAHPTLLPPITFKRGKREGRSPIDGVWMSANLHASAVSLCPASLSPGDHRATLVDIDLALLIGEPRLSIVRPKARCLNTQLPQTKACYLSLLEDHFLSHRLLSQLFQLYKDAADPSFDHVSVSPRLEKLDQLRVERMHFVEKHCRKLYMGTLAYSPTLTLWFNHKILWSLVIKKLSGGHVTSRRIRRLAQRCGIVQALSVSTEVALYNYKAAQKEYQDLQPKASQLRVEFLHQKLLSPGLSDENQQAICHVLTAGRSRETFHAI